MKAEWFMTTCGEADPAHQDSQPASDQRESVAGFSGGHLSILVGEMAASFRSLLLVLLLADFLTITLTGQRFFDALLFARLQIKRMTFYFLDDVFGLHLSLETAQSILKGFAFLNSNLCQENTPPNIPNRGRHQNTPIWHGNYIKSLVIRRDKALKSICREMKTNFSVEFST